MLIKLSKQKFSLCYLIVMFARSFKDYRGIIEHKEVTNLKLQRYFIKIILEEAKDG
uniref:Uncharacterized protein n=1 Tax=Solanum lycopersicum TaxID=4081 RepID=A0A3Q7IYS5_SOLLC